MRQKRLPLTELMLVLGLFFQGGGLSAQAQTPSGQVAALVEALRLAAPQTGRQDDGLYSDWQIMPGNIPRWSRSCIGRELTPNEFEADPETARTVVACVMRDILQEQLSETSNNEELAVRRSAAWWMRGDPSQYDNAEISDYIQRVVSYYRQQQGQTTATPPTPGSANPSNSPQTSTRPAQPQLSDYDRYMQAGYAATQQRNYDMALLYFQRALDERPDDSYAQNAIRNVERYRDRNEASGDRDS